MPVLVQHRGQRDVQARPGPWAASSVEHRLRRLGVGPDVELGRRGDVAAARGRAAHHDQPADPRGRLGEHPQQQGDVGQRADRRDGDRRPGRSSAARPAPPPPGAGRARRATAAAARRRDRPCRARGRPARAGRARATRAAPAATGTSARPARCSTRRALSVVCASSTLPCTVVTSRRSTSGLARASRIARASSMPGSVSITSGMGAGHRPIQSAGRTRAATVTPLRPPSRARAPRPGTGRASRVPRVRGQFGVRRTGDTPGASRAAGMTVPDRPFLRSGRTACRHVPAPGDGSPTASGGVAQRFGHAASGGGRGSGPERSPIPSFLLVRVPFPGRGHDLQGGEMSTETASTAAARARPTAAPVRPHSRRPARRPRPCRRPGLPARADPASGGRPARGVPAWHGPPAAAAFGAAGAPRPAPAHRRAPGGRTGAARVPAVAQRPGPLRALTRRVALWGAGVDGEYLAWRGGGAPAATRGPHGSVAKAPAARRPSRLRALTRRLALWGAGVDGEYLAWFPAGRPPRAANRRTRARWPTAPSCCARCPAPPRSSPRRLPPPRRFFPAVRRRRPARGELDRYLAEQFPSTA